jgi:hypothetical protein
MNKAVSKRIGALSYCFIAMMMLLVYSPAICYGAEYSIGVDVSPNIINIASERGGEIRVFTNLRYSAFVADGESAFIYFNESVDSVPNIWASRDCWGNLILRFSLEDLLTLGASLLPDEDNDVEVVVVMNNGDEYSGEAEVYLVDKQSR